MACIPRIPIIILCISIQQGIATSAYTLNHTGTVCNCCNILSGDWKLKHKRDLWWTQASQSLQFLSLEKNKNTEKYFYHMLKLNKHRVGYLNQNRSETFKLRADTKWKIMHFKQIPEQLFWLTNCSMTTGTKVRNYRTLNRGGWVEKHREEDKMETLQFYIR